MPGDPSEFQTRWSVIDRLHAAESTESWQWFMQRYAGYVAAVLRRVGMRADDVATATADFWGYLFRSRAIERADRSGRFRSFLCGILRNYARSWSRQNPSSVLQDEVADEPVQHDDMHESEDLALWSSQILHLALERLGREHGNDERALRWFYGIPESVGDEPAERLRATVIAQRIGCSANAMHQTLFRARSRLRDCIEAEVAATIGVSRDLGDELQLLTLAMGRAAPGMLEPQGGA